MKASGNKVAADNFIDMLYFVRMASATPCPGRTECGTHFRCDGCRARALLAKITADFEKSA